MCNQYTVVIMSYLSGKSILENIWLVLILLSIVLIVLSLFYIQKKHRINLIHVVFQLTIPPLVGYFSLYYFKQPNAKFLKELIGASSKWKRDYYELYVRKSDDFFSLEHFDLNWIAGVLTFLFSVFVIWFIFKKVRRSE